MPEVQERQFKSGQGGKAIENVKRTRPRRSKRQGGPEYGPAIQEEGNYLKKGERQN